MNRSAWVPPLVLAGLFLSACSCGQYRPSENQVVDSTKARPSGLYLPDSGTASSFRCDTSGACSLVLRDDLDTNVRWTVQFTLDSSSSNTTTLWRDL